MKKIILITLGMFFISLVCAQVPTYHQFYGNILDENKDVIIDNLEVKAYIDGVGYASAISENGGYGYFPDLFLIENAVNGDLIMFYVNGTFSNEYVFENEATTNLDLVLNSSGEILCIDSDGDGYNVTVGCGVVDCNDSNVNVNSGKIEVCSNSYDDNCDGQINEGCGDSSPISSSSPGGSNTGGDRIPRACIENWTCSDFGECDNAIQLRTCIDKNNCNTTLSKPVGSRVCSLEGGEEAEEEMPGEVGGEEKKINWYVGWLVVLCFAILVVAIIAIIIIFRKIVRRRRVREVRKGELKA